MISQTHTHTHTYDNYDETPQTHRTEAHKFSWNILLRALYNIKATQRVNSKNLWFLYTCNNYIRIYLLKKKRYRL